MASSRYPIQHIATMSTYATRLRGTRNTPSHRIYIGSSIELNYMFPLSPHDI